MLHLSYVILAAWVVSFVVDLFDRTYEPAASLHALMLAVSGTFLGGSIVRKNGGGSKKNDSEESP